MANNTLDNVQGLILANGGITGSSYNSNLLQEFCAANWTARNSPATINGWFSVTYGNDLFVAVAYTTSTTQAVMTSPDGINWTIRSSPSASNGWYSVTYGSGLFVAVAYTTSTTQAVMTSLNL